MGSTPNGDQPRRERTTDAEHRAGTPTERRNSRVAERYVREVMVDRNLEAIEEIFADPADWTEVSLYGDLTVETYGELREVYERDLVSLEEFSIRSVVADGAEVMVRWTAAGRVSSDFPGVPRAGEQFETTAVTAFGFEDGEIVELDVHVNELDLLPEVSWPAVRGIVREMRDGVVVVDDEGRIVHVNPAAVALFDRSRKALLGESVETLMNERGQESPPGECAVTGGPDGRYFGVSESPLTGDDGERIGRMLVLRDVTERRRRVQQLEVLNRVLRHDLRSALQVVRGRIELARERVEPSVAAELTPALAATERLLSTAETARQARSALDGMEVGPRDLGEVLASVVARARERYPAATVEASVTGAPTVEAPAAVEDALWELVENACEHAGERPRVEVSVDRDGDAAEVTVADDGPGLPESERRVLDAGGETDLEHGSGLGLWLAQWVIDAGGGSLGFAVGDGTTARVTLPLASGEDPRRSGPAASAGD